MTASVNNVKELRERTGAGILDCQAALKDSSGDIEKAIDFLRKKGVASAAKRAGREAKEGLIVSEIRGQKAVMIEANCETDFVARTGDFSALASMAAEETFLKGDLASTSSEKLTQRVAELSGKIGEKILVRRTKLVESPKGIFFTYIHSNKKLGVLLEIVLSKPENAKNADFQELGKNLAMQVAASHPLCLTRAEVPASTLEREKAIFREEVKGKPENIVEKIIQGKLEKFYQTACLLEQPFIKEDKKSVKALIEETAKKINDGIEIKRFVRFQLGETLAS